MQFPTPLFVTETSVRPSLQRGLALAPVTDELRARWLKKD